MIHLNFVFRPIKNFGDKIIPISNEPISIFNSKIVDEVGENVPVVFVGLRIDTRHKILVNNRFTVYFRPDERKEFEFKSTRLFTAERIVAND